jgi:hypothetical protein
MEKHVEKIEDELKAQVDKYYEKYCDSPGWIDYSVNYVGHCGTIKSIIVDTICKLPKDVKKFACEECLFVSVADGICLSLVNAKHKWTIVLSETVEIGNSATVAKNIAHAWLRHKSSSDMKLTPPGNADDQILTLITAWGFAALK